MVSRRRAPWYMSPVRTLLDDDETTTIEGDDD
jgi:hypothetical protein